MKKTVFKIVMKKLCKQKIKKVFAFYDIKYLNNINGKN